VKQPKKSVTAKHEVRKGQRPEIRKTASGARTVSGYFLSYGNLSADLGGFKEIIQKGAVKSLNNPDIDFVADYNHDSNMILARVSNGSLSVNDDGVGLRYRMTLPIGVSYVDDLVALMESNGLISDCSFQFSVNPNGESWAMEGDQLVRTLTSITVYSGSIVGQPAYPKGTVADLRNCPVAFRSKLSKRDGSESDSPDDHPGQHWSDEDDDWVDDSMSEADDDTDEEWNSRSASFRCQYRCLHCRSIHSNLTEDDPSARSANSNLTEDYFAVRCAKRCAERCQQCRSMSSHYPTANAVNEDDPLARAHAHLLSLRR
jgi:uncharacterized protein